MTIAAMLAVTPVVMGLGAQAAAASTNEIRGGSAYAAVMAPAYAPCPAQHDASSCDADGDRIPDTVERVVCGTATCATGRELNSRRVPKWVSVMACGSVNCASPTKDGVGDGMPDYARQIVCGSATCYTDNRDLNAHGVPKWASVVICGTTGCATGHEDYDGDGISDAVELAACVTARNDLAHTGAVIPIVLLVAIAAGLIGVGLLLRRRRPLFDAATMAQTGATA